MSVFNCALKTTDPLTFFNWRSTLNFLMCNLNCSHYLELAKYEVKSTFSMLSFQDGYPNRWNCGAFALPLAAYAVFTNTDSLYIKKRFILNEQPSLNIQLSCSASETVYQLRLSLYSPAVLTLTPSNSTWARLCLNTLSCSAPLPPTSHLLETNSAEWQRSVEWKRAFDRLQWLKKAERLLPQINKDECTTAMAELCGRPSIRSLLTQAESLCFYKAVSVIDKNNSKLSLSAKRLEGQRSNLLKGFHNFYQTTKILSGSTPSQMAMLRLAQAVGYALNL
ncbi:MAG: hypothetical protein ACI376_00790 [Candidatus Bruticola sp.]